MRILIHGLNFAPEVTGIGKFTGELAEYLATKGEEVRVVTTPPYYPHWKVLPGFSGKSYRREVWRGVQVYRCPLWVPQNPTGLTRVLHLTFFALSSLPAMLAQLRWKPDIILNVVPAITSSPISLLAARLARCTTWLHVHDFELDAAFNLGLLPGARTANQLLQRIESRMLNGFDRVSTISQRMVERLWQKGVSEDKTYLLPNWVDPNSIYPLSTTSTFREEWALDGEQILVLYTGNMGEKQGLGVLVDAARQLQAVKNLHFVLCGEGAARSRLVEQAGDLPNLRFLHLQPEKRLNELLNAGDIQVLPQRSNTADLVMPSKLAGMLASGKPVIACANPNTEIAQIILQVGYLVPPENPAALCDAILNLANDAGKRRDLGCKGRSYAQENWAKDTILSRFLEQLHSIAAPNSYHSG